MRLNLEDENVFTLDLTTDEARNLDEEEVADKITSVMDTAQAYVHMKTGPRSYVVIKIE